MISKAKAIVVKSFSYSESSLISRLLLDNGSKLSLMIKGAKSLKENKGALFQSMNLIGIDYYYKNNREIQLFKEGYLITDFPAVKKNYQSMIYGLCIIDIMDKTLPKDYQDIKMFNMTEHSLSMINSKYDYKIVFIFFLLSFSHYNGYGLADLDFNDLRSDKALELFNNNQYEELLKYMNGLDLDSIIRKTISFIQSYVPEIKNVKSLRFIN